MVCFFRVLSGQDRVEKSLPREYGAKSGVGTGPKSVETSLDAAGTSARATVQTTTSDGLSHSYDNSDGLYDHVMPPIVNGSATDAATMWTTP